MGNRHLAGADGAKPVSTPQIHGHCPQDGQHLNAVAVFVEMGVFPQQDVPDPVPGIFDTPALPHQAQQGFWAGAQGGQEVVAMIERLAVAAAGAMQLNDPTGLSPIFSDAFSGLHGPQIPGDRAAVAAFALADLHRKLAAKAELILDLAVQPGLVPLLLRRSLTASLPSGRRRPAPLRVEKRFGRVQGVRLDQHAIEVHRRQEFPQGLALVGIARVVRGLGVAARLLRSSTPPPAPWRRA